MKASNTFLSRLIRISDNLAAATDEAWGFLGWRLFKTWHNMRQSVTGVGVDLGPFGSHTSCQIKDLDQWVLIDPELGSLLVQDKIVMNPTTTLRWSCLFFSLRISIRSPVVCISIWQDWGSTSSDWWLVFADDIYKIRIKRKNTTTKLCVKEYIRYTICSLTYQVPYDLDLCT